MKKPTLTIGIPAYNEEANIGRIIEALLKQNQKSYKLKSIIVISDMSSDGTYEKASEFKSSTVKVFKNKMRTGKPEILNQLLEKTTTDIFVQLDADILLKDALMINKLITPIVVDNVDLTSAKVVEYWPRNRFERILKISMLMKKEIFEQFKNGDNVFTCHGRARAFSKKLYTKIHFKKDILAEDAYSYLFAVSNNFKYRYANEARVYYKLPTNLHDHARQSTRFFNSYKMLEKIFDKSIIEEETKLPQFLIFKVTLKYFFKYPLTLTSYIGIVVAMKKKAAQKTKNSALWNVAVSSKHFD